MGRGRGLNSRYWVLRKKVYLSVRIATGNSTRIDVTVSDNGNSGSDNFLPEIRIEVELLLIQELVAQRPLLAEPERSLLTDNREEPPLPQGECLGVAQAQNARRPRRVIRDWLALAVVVRNARG
jgi:hypothetical protein